MGCLSDDSEVMQPDVASVDVHGNPIRNTFAAKDLRKANCHLLSEQHQRIQQHGIARLKIQSKSCMYGAVSVSGLYR